MVRANKTKGRAAIVVIALAIVALVGTAFMTADTVSAAAKPKSSQVRIGAANWAIKIANDNTFRMGTGHKAHTAGCYFCGTNKTKKGAGYWKTYCCNPFVLAAYAHGGKDPKCLADCKKGRPGPISKSEFKSGGYLKQFTIMGKPAYKKLCKGDILSDNNTFCTIYVGNEKMVMLNEGNGKDSIRIVPLTQKTYASMFKFVARYK